MRISKHGIKKFNLAIAFFIAFAGYYFIIMTMANLGMRDMSRIMTIPMRIIIVACLGLLFIIRPKIKIQNGLFFFLVFAILYYLRITLEVLQGNSSFHIPVVSFLLYFTSFVFLPLFFTSQLKLKRENYSLIFFAIIIGCLFLSIGTYFYYSNLIGEIRRISSSASESNISPLSLSYVSVLGIGISISYLFTNKVKGIKKIAVYLTIFSCLIPFFLGASRGAVIALFGPFIFYFLFKKGLKNKITIITSLTGIGILFAVAAQYLGVAVFERFINIGSAIEAGGSSASRLQIWQSSWHQFVENPLFGNSLETNSIHMYPHNIFLEALISTGIFGFIAYLLFLFFTLREAKKIMRLKPSHYFIVVIFLQALVKAMFSGGIYTTSWLAIGAGLILGYNYKQGLNHKIILKNNT